MSTQKENYYELLKIDPKATVPEIVAAYHRARSTFSRDSLATYSILSKKEINEILETLEIAFQTLTNLEARAKYDREIRLLTTEPEIEEMLHSLDKEQRKRKSQLPRHAPPSSGPKKSTHKKKTLPPIELLRADGAEFASVREQRGYSVDQVSKITKIPTKFILALEADEKSKLPARVYVHGFIKNMAQLYQIDAKVALELYFKEDNN